MIVKKKKMMIDRLGVFFLLYYLYLLIFYIRYIQMYTNGFLLKCLVRIISDWNKIIIINDIIKKLSNLVGNLFH